MSGPFIVFLILSGVVSYACFGVAYGIFYGMTLEGRRARCRHCTMLWNCRPHRRETVTKAMYLWPWGLACDLVAGLVMAWQWAQPVAILKRREERMTVLVKGRGRRD